MDILEIASQAANVAVVSSLGVLTAELFHRWRRRRSKSDKVSDTLITQATETVQVVNTDGSRLSIEVPLHAGNDEILAVLEAAAETLQVKSSEAPGARPPAM